MNAPASLFLRLSAMTTTTYGLQVGILIRASFGLWHNVVNLTRNRRSTFARANLTNASVTNQYRFAIS